MSFVNAAVTTEPTQLLDDGIDGVNSQLNANGFPGWKAGDATLAVIMLGTIAQMVADAANVAATVAPAIFRSFGTLLLGVQYQGGTNASVLSTWTFTSPAPVGGYFIAQGTVVVIDGIAFYTQTDYTSLVSDTTAAITLVASQSGTASNGIGGVNVGLPRVALNEGIDFVSTVVTQGITSGGQDQETDPAYQDRLKGALKLQAPRPLVYTDFAGMLLSDIAASATGVAVGRAGSTDLYFPDGRVLSTGGAGGTVLSCTTVNASPTVTLAAPSGNQVPTVGATVTGTGIPGGTTVAATPAPTEATFTLSQNATASATNNLTISALSGYGPVHLTCVGTTTNTSPTISAVTPPYPGAIADVGARVRGTGIPAGATVLASPAPTSSSFTISANATSSNAGETVTVSSWTNVALANASFVTDLAGNALTPASLDALQTWLQTFRPQNWLTYVVSASYSTVYVSSQIHVLANYSATSVAASVQNALLSYLNPASWGTLPQQNANTSPYLTAAQGFNIVRLNKLIGIVENVPGVDYIPPGQLTLGFSPSPGGTTDLTLPGPAPLPLSTTTSVPLPTVV